MGAPLTIYAIQLAHTDIGYTHPQEQIGLMYLEHYDRVLELCRATAGDPEPQRFKWVCETFWQVRHYLSHRPEREAELVEYARRGQIEITAGYLHFTDLIDPDAYRRSLLWAVEFCRRHDIPLRSVVHCDINGWPWAVADLLAELDIPYFCSQVHVDSATDPLGRRGSVHYHWVREWGDALRPGVPVRTPQAFWWRGPRGGRVLHWLNEHYLLGNVLGVSSPKPFGADKTRYFLETDRLSAGDLYALAERELPPYAERLRADGYPYDIMLLSTGGYYVDNSPPDGRWLEVIARWNREHDDIQIRTATLSEWFQALEARLPAQLPEHQVAWPDHWAHGLGSATARVAQARRTQRRRPAVAALAAESGSAAAARALDVALEQERLALEHTFNAWSTTAHPSAPVNSFQQAAKELTFHRAEMYMDEAVGAALRALTPPDAGGPLLYAKPPAAGRATLHFDSGDLTLDPSRHALVDGQGREVPIQRDDPDLPRFVASPELGGGLGGLRVVERPAAAPAAPSGGSEITAGGWSLRVDPATGALASLRDASGREWAGARAGYGFGQIVHEAVVHPAGREAVGNGARLIALGAASDSLVARYPQGPAVERTTPAAAGAPQVTRGAVFDEVAVQLESARVGRARAGWRLYHDLPVVELVLDWDKAWSDLPEAVYVAFPFAAAGARLELETSGGFFTPGAHGPGGQLPGTCHSYYTIQRAARITAGGAGLLWAPVDSPLVMVNEVDYARWETDEWQWTGLVASMPVNHYWHTNFATSQRGPLRLRYRIAAAGPDTEADLAALLPVDALGWR